MTFTEFCQAELGLVLTAGQRVLSLVAFDGLEPKDLAGADRDTARVLFGEVDTVPPAARRVRVLLLGRISGKTLLSAAFALFTMATADVSQCGPGDLPVALVIAPTKKLAGLAVRAGLELARRSPRLRKRIERETSEGFVLRRRDNRLVAFEAAAASRGGAAGRGVTILVAIFDEGEFFLSDEGGAFVINDRDIFAAIAPRARCMVMISTPWPTPSLMSEMHQQNWQNPTTALAAKAPTLVMRDDDETIAVVVDAERQRDPANAAREFDCDDSALSGGGLFFDALAISACVDARRPLVVGAPVGARVKAAGDLSATRDPSTLAVVATLISAPTASTAPASMHSHVLELLELRPEKGKPLKMSETIATFAQAIKRHGINAFTADGWGREAAREFATPHGIGIEAAPEGREAKTASYITLRTLIGEGRITLPPHPRLIQQLRAVTSKPAAGGGLIISSPRRAGSHGDLVSALVLACASSGKLTMIDALKIRQARQRDGLMSEQSTLRRFGINDATGLHDWDDLRKLVGR